MLLYIKSIYSSANLLLRATCFCCNEARKPRCPDLPGEKRALSGYEEYSLSEKKEEASAELPSHPAPWQQHELTLFFETWL